MPLGPESLDYEGVFRGRKRERPEAHIDVSPPTKSTNSFENPSLEPSSSIRQDAIASAVEPQTNPINRRGHAATFVGLFLFSIVLYIRPYEFFPGLSSFTSM